MPSERENLSQSLTPIDYDIAGNHIRAYYDARRKLVFVIDYAINERKPNVLLVINSYGDRKWDDVLANDYSVDLETVRPKKDNKYQKLDIEYGALGIYDDLITGFDAGDDIGAVLHALDEFRMAASRRAATERLTAADVTAENARETIEKTDETIAGLQAKIKTLRAKLSAQRKEVGKEPTKQSAAKILRTEAQIDATNEKLARAKKRLDNAKRRLAAAEEDAEAARGILNMTATTVALESPDKFPPTPDTELVAVRDALPAQVMPENTDVVPFNADTENNNNETKAENMADEEVKPLFDKDPEILDEEIAFKPIDFSIPAAPAQPARSPRPESDDYSDGGVVSPLSFVPPTATQPVSDVEPAPIDVTPAPATPVLDTITSVEMPGETETIITQEPIMNVEPAPVTPAPTPMPEISVAPVSSDFRPVSPITGGAAQNAAGPTRQKPTMIYYVMLVLLIALSIFTLWIYQKSVNNNVPDLTATTSAGTETAAVAPAPVQEQNAPSPFIDVQQPVVEQVEVKETETVRVEPVSVQASVQPEPEPVVVTEPEPMPVVAPAPVEVMPVTEPEPVPVSVEPEPVSVEPEPVVVEPDTTAQSAQPVAESPFLSEPVAQPEPIINKPAYNVSQQENMFVAAPDYETDVEYSQTETVDDTNAPTCSDGGAPDMYGCCAGEEFTDMGDGTAACCNGDECFPPMF